MAAVSRKGEVAIGLGLGVLALIAVSAIVFFLVLTGVRHGQFRDFGRAHAPVADAARSNVDATMEAQFPDDYHRIVTAANAQTGASDRAQVITALLSAWRREHYLEAARAPHDKLAAWQAAQRDLGEALRQQSSELCGNFYRGPLGSAAESLTPQANAMADAESIALIVAVRGGIDMPVDRPRPGMADGRALYRALLREGMSESTANDYLSGHYHPQDNRQLCSVMGMVDRSLARLDPAVEDRLLAVQLRALAAR